MARVADGILIQHVDGEGAVFMDDLGNEVVVPDEAIERAIGLLQYFQESLRA